MQKGYSSQAKIQALRCRKSAGYFRGKRCKTKHRRRKKALPFWMVSETFLQLIRMVGRY